MREEVKKKIMKEVEVVDHEIIKCDRCGKVIYDVNKAEEYLKGRTYDKVRYYTLDVGHHDWGNESVESCESFDLCSLRCLSDQLSIFFNENKSSYTAYAEIRTDSEMYHLPEETK